MEMSPVANRSIQPRPLPPVGDGVVSAPTCPLWIPEASTVRAGPPAPPVGPGPAQISTHWLLLAMWPGRGGSLQRLPGGAWLLLPMDCTRPWIVTPQACRCTRSAPGLPPRLPTLPLSPTVNALHASIVIARLRALACVAADRAVPLVMMSCPAYH